MSRLPSAMRDVNASSAASAWRTRRHRRSRATNQAGRRLATKRARGFSTGTSSPRMADPAVFDARQANPNQFTSCAPSTTARSSAMRWYRPVMRRFSITGSLVATACAHSSSVTKALARMAATAGRFRALRASRSAIRRANCASACGARATSVS